MMAAMPGRERWKTGSGSAVCQASWKEVAALGDGGTRGVHDDEKNNTAASMCYIPLIFHGRRRGLHIINVPNLFNSSAM